MTTRLLFIVFAILVSSGHSQECQDVADSVNFFIQQGSSFCVNCPVSGSSIQWTIDLVLLDDVSPSLDYEILPNNSLLMRSSQEGNYQCEDEDNAFNTHQFTVTLAVDMPPFINQPTVYNETDNVRIICASDATPPPRGIIWQRNDVEVSSNPILSFSSIQRNNASIYTCCARRELAGESVITCSNFTITVQYPPTILTSSPANSEASVDTDHMIQCTFDGVPTPTVVWLHDGTMLTDGSNDITIATGDSSSTLTITTLTADDSGSYTCMVSNLLGTVTASSTLQVQFPPNAPSGVMVTATTTTQLSLSWTNPSKANSPSVTMVMITYQLTGSPNVTETADTITSHTITGLMPNMEYIIFLQSINTIGSSGSVSVTGMTQPLPPNAPTVRLIPSSSTSIGVMWTPAPTNSSMTLVTNWTLLYHPTDDGSDVTMRSHDANTNEDELTGLSKGTSYTVSVAASNTAGMGPFDEQVTSTLIDSPSEPTNLTAVALSHSRVRVTWGPVSDDGGAPIDQYRLVVTGPGLSSSNVPQFAPDVREHTIEGLVNNTNYTIHLAASNSQGFGPNAAVTVETLDIGVPTPPILMEPSNTDVLDVSVTLRWNEPMDIDIASYRIEYRIKIDQPEWTVVIVDPPVTSRVITGLSPLTTYEVRIFAISVDDVTSVTADPLSVTTGAQLPVMITGDTVIPYGETLELTCLLSDGGVPFSPQWRKDSGELPQNATLEGSRGNVLMIRSVIFTDAGVYTCTNEQFSKGGPATVNVTITMDTALTSESSDGLGEMEYILIGIGGAILVGILILGFCIICVCCVRYRRRPKIYSPSKGHPKSHSPSKGSNWIDGDGHTGIVFMASSYSTSSQSPSQREDTTDAPYLGCKEDDFQNASTFNTLERSAIHSYQQNDTHSSPQDNNTADKPHRAHYAELDLAPSSKYTPVSANTVHYAQVDKSSFKRKRSLSPPHTKAVPVPVQTPTAAAAKKQYDNPTYGMSGSYHYPVTPGDTVV